MKLEDQVVSLEFAKRLKELGVKQESYFGFNGHGVLEDCAYFEAYPGDFYCSAFTCSELGEILKGRGIYSWRGDYGWKCHHSYLPDDGEQSVVTVTDGETEADCRAKMLIHLIERGLVKTENR